VILLLASECSAGTTSGCRVTGANWQRPLDKSATRISRAATYVLAVVSAWPRSRKARDRAFFYGIAAGGGLSAGSLIAGGALGLASGVAVGQRSSWAVRIPAAACSRLLAG